jgi:hypothetical protein
MRVSLGALASAPGDEAEKKVGELLKSCGRISLSSMQDLPTDQQISNVSWIGQFVTRGQPYTLLMPAHCMMKLIGISAFKAMKCL